MIRKDDIGANAGIVWRMLSTKEKMTVKELLLLTDLDLLEMGAAIGWLARENKINLTEENGKVFYSVFRESYY